MNLALAPELNPQAGREALAGEERRAQLRDFLAPASAAALAAELENLAHWDLALTDTRRGPYKLTHAELAALEPSRRARIMEELRRQSRSGFSFAYYRRDVLPGDDPVLPEFARWIQSGEFLDTMRALTGMPELTRSDAHASCYRPGSFLKLHDDTYAGRSRRYAWVLNLTRHWEADWGGLLHFTRDGAVTASFMPWFNALSIFAVPQDHFVSQVATYARAPRFAITGWLFDD